MVRCSVLALVLSSLGAISECRANDEHYVEMMLSRSGMSNTPQWMPDGETIVVSRNERLHTIDVLTGQVEILSQKERSPSDILQIDYSPNISPDGTRIAFTTHRFVTDGHYSWDIALLEFDESGEPRRRTRQLGPFSLSLDPGPIQLTRSKARDRNPIWSPDGSRIAFLSDRVETRPGSDRLYVMSPDESDVISVAPDVSASQGPVVWSPDGTKLAFTNSPEKESCRIIDGVRSCAFSLYIVRADGSGVEMVYEGFESQIRPYPSLAWSPDGLQIAIAIPRSGVFVADTTQRIPPRLIHDLGDSIPILGNRIPWGLFWPPPGDEVLYFAGGILWSSTIDGRSRRTLWEPDDSLWGPEDSWIWWEGDILAMSMSPDDSQIAAYSVSYGSYGLSVVLINLDGSFINLVKESDWPDVTDVWTEW